MSPRSISGPDARALRRSSGWCGMRCIATLGQLLRALSAVRPHMGSVLLRVHTWAQCYCASTHGLSAIARPHMGSVLLRVQTWAQCCCASTHGLSAVARPHMGS
eukprot:359232-Chlamydomonas_euryale.AAC.6